MFAKIAIAALAALPSALASVTGNSNVALYWGQNSAGGADTQESLAYYCQNTDADIVMVSFLNTFTGAAADTPNLNLANACGTTFANSTILSCPTVGADIKTCQSLGKTVLLSLGGAGSTYDLTSDANAENLADQLWKMFGPVDSTSGALRPFGDAVVDGFDLDIEQGTSTYYPTLVNSLRTHYATDASKTYYVAASPQCPTPDAHLNDAITKSVIDFVFVQFYNNYCGMQSVGTSDFNFAAWDALVSGTSTKVFLGVAGGPSAALSGYVDAATVVSEARSLQSTYSSFGGVSIWDASQAFPNDNFAKVVKAGLLGSAASSSAASSSSAATSAASSAAGAAASASSLVDPAAVTKCVNCDGSAGVVTVKETFTAIDSTDCDTTTVKPTVTATVSCSTLTVHTTYLTTVECETTSNGVVGVGYKTVTVDTTFLTTVTPATSTPVAAAVVKTTSPAAVAVVFNSTTVANGTSQIPVVAAASKTTVGVAASNNAARAVPGLLAILGFLLL